MRFSLVAATVLTAVPLVAQNRVVFPSAAAQTPGATEERRFPFGNGVSRNMAVFESWDLGIPNGSQITSIGVRQRLGRTSPATGVQLEIYMGPAGVDVSTMSNRFDNNYESGVTPQLVFGPAIVNLPALSSSATTAQDIMINLTTPYTFDATKNLVVEYRVLANSNGNGVFDYYLDQATFVSPTSQFGTACASSAGQLPVLSFTAAHIGGNLRARMTNAPASSFVYLNIDTVLGPSLNGAPFGAPGCTLYVPPVLVETRQQGGTTGTTTFDLAVPYDPALYQLDVYGQCLVADLFANSLGFVGSNGAQITLGARAAMGTVVRTGSLTSTTGSLRAFHGVVSVFRWQ